MKTVPGRVCLKGSRGAFGANVGGRKTPVCAMWQQGQQGKRLLTTAGSELVHIFVAQSHFLQADQLST